MIRRSPIFRLCTSAALLLVLACATPLREQRWYEVSSDRFTVVSNLELDEVKKLVLSLEQFHALVTVTTNLRDYESPIPTEIVAFKSRSQLAKFTGARDVAGVFIPGLRSNLVLLAESGTRLSATDVVRHEYVHYVVANGSDARVPLWYNEGFAEFLSTARVSDGKMVVGGVPRIRADWIQRGIWLDARTLIETSNLSELRRSDIGMFYAQAWLLVHYLNLDRQSDQKMIDGLNRYTALLGRGADPVEAFEQGFGEDVDSLNERLRNTASGRHGSGLQLVGMDVDKLAYDREPPRVRDLAPGDVSLALARVCLRYGDWDCVRERAKRAVEAAPSNARAHAMLGDGYKVAKEWDQAESSFRRALELAGDDPMVRLDWGEYLLSRAYDTPGEDERRKLLGEARETFRALLAANERNPEAWTVLAQTYGLPGEDLSRALPAIDRAFEQLPSSDAVKQTRAQLLLLSGQRLEAIRAIHGWLGLGHVTSPQTADEILEGILEQQRQLASSLGVDYVEPKAEY